MMSFNPGAATALAALRRAERAVMSELDLKSMLEVIVTEASVIAGTRYVKVLAVAIRNASLFEAEGSARRAAEQALAEVKALRGLLPICSYCKKVRNDENYWEQIESYICQHSDAQFSHSICPECRDGVVRDELARWRERR